MTGAAWSGVVALVTLAAVSPAVRQQAEAQRHESVPLRHRSMGNKG